MHLLYSCGKTSLAYLILGLVSKHGGASCVKLSAVYAGVADLKQVVKTATNNRVMFGKRTVLFLDEIHRFNKSQQDAFVEMAVDHATRYGYDGYQLDIEPDTLPEGGLSAVNASIAMQKPYVDLLLRLEAALHAAVSAAVFFSYF